MTQPVLPKTDPPLHETRIHGARVTFTDEGSPNARVFIAIHGAPGSVRDFRYLAPQVTPFARFIRMDLPGSGGSAPRLAALRSLEARAQTVLALADELGITTFGVVGHSMGGGTALLTASMASARVTHLVLIAPMGLRSHQGLSRSPASFRRIALLLRIPIVRAFMLPQVRKHFRKRRFPRANEMTAKEYATHFESFSAADFALLRRVAAAPLPSRTLVAFSEDDPLVEAQIPIELAEAIPGSRQLRFKDGGHVIQKTKSVEIAQAMRELR